MCGGKKEAKAPEGAPPPPDAAPLPEFLPDGAAPPPAEGGEAPPPGSGSQGGKATDASKAASAVGGKSLGLTSKAGAGGFGAPNAKVAESALGKQPSLALTPSAPKGAGSKVAASSKAAKG